MTAYELLVQPLSTNGDGTGTTSATGNYASAAETFEIAHTTGGALVIKRLVVLVQDDDAFEADIYGGSAALTNGLDLNVVNSSNVLIFALTPIPIKTNAEWGRYAYDADLKTWSATPGPGVDQILLSRWTFAKFAHNADEGIRLDNGEKLVLTVNDDLTFLVDHTFMCEGYVDSEEY